MTSSPQCCLYDFPKVHFVFSIPSYTQELLDPDLAWRFGGFCFFRFLFLFSTKLKKKFWQQQPLPPLPITVSQIPSPLPSLLLFREGKSPTRVSPLGHQFTAGLLAFSPIEAILGSLDRGRGSSGRLQSQRQSLLQLLGESHEDQVEHLYECVAALGPTPAYFLVSGSASVSPKVPGQLTLQIFLLCC